MKHLIIIFIILFMSCKTKDNSQKTIIPIDYSSQGFTKVEWKKSDVCGIILTAKSGEKFEIENIALDILESKSQTVWIKYHALRRLSKCNNTMPINITDYKLQ